jgi:DNA-binding NtrC family response regulator
VARHVLIGPDAPIQAENSTHRTRNSFLTEGAPPVKLKQFAKGAIKELERSVILEALRANQWNRRKTAVALKISYRALIYKIHEAGLVSKRGNGHAVTDTRKV